MLLQIEELRTSFATASGEAFAVDGISLQLDEGHTLGLVGESGCGKTATALSILRLLPPAGRIAGGRILFAGRDLATLSVSELRAIRGDQIAMIFQEPMTALNPLFTIGNQIGEVLRLHRGASRAEARQQAIELLRRVEISEPENRVHSYPHQLSGGMRQRAMIAMALACRPKLLIADEPTTALDVTVQAQILDLLQQLQRETGMALLLVTHDLGIVAERADTVAVMYAGRIIESGPARAVLNLPLHPYTRGLLGSLPRVTAAGRERLQPIAGIVPEITRLPSGCRFRDRCPDAIAACAEVDPRLEELAADHRAACIRLVRAAGGYPAGLTQ
ncbi:MAG TPA: ABC transporter ATP-binding protein [Terriglobales bacterium]|nr:ABC transporter ATP-binding protein [Terriglobales bacterium]